AIAVLLLACVTSLAEAASVERTCARSCVAGKAACVADAKGEGPTLRAACTGRGPDRRRCRRQAGAIIRAARRACMAFKRTCRSCCADAGTDCAARCGDGVVTASHGETCDPAGVACPGGGTCGGDCRCPVVTTTLPQSSTTSVPSSSTTTTTTPPPGAATFGVSAGTTWFASSAPGFGILSGSASGALVLAATPTGGGDASLVISNDSVFGVRFIGDTILCFQVLADGSSGLPNCAAAPSGVAVDWTPDGKGFGPTLSSVLRPALGGPSGPGAAVIVAAARTVACVAGVAVNDPGCLDALDGPADCRDPAKVRYTSAPFALALTTGTATATITSPRPDSTPEPIPTSASGIPFTCVGDARLGADVTLAIPLPAVALAGIGGWTSVGGLPLVRGPGG